MSLTVSPEHLVSKLKGRVWQELHSAERELVVEKCFLYWRENGFPHYEMTVTEMQNEYRRLCKVSPNSILLEDEVQISMTGLRLANLFHPQMWSVRAGRAHSPTDRFDDDAQLRKAIRKSFNICADRYGANASNLRSILRTISNTTRVSNFRPTAAKALYEKFSGDGATVLDFSAGYGGRLLGCLPLKRRYIGIEPCSEQIDGLKNMVEKLSGIAAIHARVQLFQACAEDFLPQIESNTVDMIFSSPPYFNRERYSTEATQSYLRYPKYEIWLEKFLGKIIAESRRILKPHGYFLLNVADIKNYRIAEDALRIAAASDFKLQNTLKLRLSCKPYLRKRAASVFKYEPIFVFKPSAKDEI